jgi:hypothetical protein
VELYEQIRREYEFGAGSISARRGLDRKRYQRQHGPVISGCAARTIGVESRSRCGRRSLAQESILDVPAPESKEYTHEVRNHYGNDRKDHQ